jgi:hypothetical protein
VDSIEFISCSPELPALSCEKNPNDIPYFAMKVMENLSELGEGGRVPLNPEHLPNITPHKFG